MSPRRIRVLDEATINQIAAGEVIENPASVVKELVENAIDAGATEICVETKAGGRSLIKVSDDGCGMSRDDLLLSLERHATSKLSAVEDLEVLGTLGFRGEALPSIASVSKMILHSAQGEGGGTLVPIEGGRIGSIQPYPRQMGTTIEVKSLFYNVPVRKKFQKSLGWDTAEIHKTLIKFALCCPQVGFTWVNDEKQQFAYLRGEGEEKRIHALLGDEFLASSLSVEHRQDSLTLTGRISRPSLHRPNRTGQYLFINQRAIISPWVAQKVLEAYGTRLSSHRYPLFVLYLTLPAAWVDVNVHPQKREVRLREEERLAPFIIHAIEKAFGSRPSISPSFSPITFPETVEPLFVAAESPPSYRPTPSAELFLFEEPSFHIIGKVKNYFFVEEAQGIRVVDEIRATERIIFEQLQVEEAKQEVQALLLPIQLKRSGHEKSLLSEQLEALNALGISIRHFGGDTFLIDAIPAILEPEEIPELIDAFVEEGRIPKHLGKCLKRRGLSIGAGGALMKRLFQCQNSDTTPSGKPIHTLLNETTLDRLMQ